MIARVFSKFWPEQCSFPPMAPWMGVHLSREKVDRAIKALKNGRISFSKGILKNSGRRSHSKESNKSASVKPLDVPMEGYWSTTGVSYTEEENFSEYAIAQATIEAAIEDSGIESTIVKVSGGWVIVIGTIGYLGWTPFSSIGKLYQVALTLFSQVKVNNQHMNVNLYISVTLLVGLAIQNMIRLGIKFNFACFSIYIPDAERAGGIVPWQFTQPKGGFGGFGWGRSSKSSSEDENVEESAKEESTKYVQDDLYVPDPDYSVLPETEEEEEEEEEEEGEFRFPWWLEEDAVRSGSFYRSNFREIDFFTQVDESLMYQWCSALVQLGILRRVDI